MSWAHELAAQFRQRDNPKSAAWAAGRVLSPRRGEDGQLAGELVIEAFGLMLRGDRLSVPEGAVLEAGQVVPLVGNPFDGQAGAQRILVIPPAVTMVDETLLDWEVE